MLDVLYLMPGVCVSPGKAMHHGVQRRESQSFVGHHILDRILKHVLDTYGSKTTTKPSLNYKFIDELLENYKELQSEYKAEKQKWMWTRTPAGGDDFKFLYELCKAFQHCKKHAAFPVIKWRKLPSLHSARWNSRAIYTLIAYFLLPSWGSGFWSFQHVSSLKSGKNLVQYSKIQGDTYDNLLLGITKLGCASALKCLTTHWSRAPSVLDVPRSNMIAKRAVKEVVLVRRRVCGKEACVWKSVGHSDRFLSDTEVQSLIITFADRILIAIAHYLLHSFPVVDASMESSRWEAAIGRRPDSKGPLPLVQISPSTDSTRASGRLLGCPVPQEFPILEAEGVGSVETSWHD
ncbi:hypothetical protein GWK47_002279 [Chionoecetes opilio]|uniref:Uncharacterized protein n=1 Tax=Chionoecetes opilio TaxID=41210 RepID=A0A8J5BW82_CHIOP|nr:hypothetical protein GWK47_002279 [Chionoecetes opilio]